MTVTHHYQPSRQLGKAIAAQRLQLVAAIARAAARGASVSELARLFHWPDDSIVFLLVVLVGAGVLVVRDEIDEETIHIRYFLPEHAPASTQAPGVAPQEVSDEPA